MSANPRRAARDLVALPCLCANLRRASRAVTQLYDRALRPVGLRTTQLTLLQVLERSTRITSARLGALLAVDATTLSRTLRPLERRGWIATAQTADRRERELYLTLAGRHQLARALSRWNRVQASLRARLGRAEWRRAITALERTTIAAVRSAPRRNKRS